MAGFLSKIFGGGAAGQSGSDPLFVLLKDLDKWERGLTARAVTYIRDCDGRPVLSAIAAKRPGRNNPNYNNTNWQAVQAQMANENAYSHHFGGQPDALARYTEVISAKQGLKPNRGRWNSELADETPDAVANFLTILAQHNRHYLGTQQKEQPKPKTPTTFNDVLEAIDSLEGTPADLVASGFANRYSGSSVSLEGKPLSKQLAALPISHFVTALNRRKATDKVMMLQRLEKEPVAKDPTFLDFLIESAGAGSSQLRVQAIKMLASHDPVSVEKRMLPLLSKGSAASRGGAVQALGAIGSDTALAAMKDRLKAEKSQDVIAAINFYVGGGAAAADDAPKGSYTAHDGSIVDIPDVKPLVDDGSEPFDASDLEELRKLDIKQHEKNLRWYENGLLRYNENLKKKNNPYKGNKPQKPKNMQGGEALYKLLNAPIERPSLSKVDPKQNNRRGVAFHYYYHLQAWTLGAVTKLPPARLVRAALLTSGSVAAAANEYANPIGRELSRRLQDGSIDVRQLLAVALEFNMPLSQGFYGNKDNDSATDQGYVDAMTEKDNPYGGIRRFKAAWPITANFLPQVLAIMPPQVTNVYTNMRALNMLADMPKLPAAAVDAVLFAALDTRPRVSEPAQKLLQDVDGIDDKVIATLTDKRQAVRANAASFLADRGVERAVAPIVKRLKTEKSETARADMISAVSRLGGNTAPYLGKAALMKEAEAFVAKLPNAKIEWLELETAPALKWADGKAVDPVITDAWLRLALKLKDPKGSPLFGLYFDQLERESVTAFCDWVLRSWIAYDTWRPASGPLREKAQKQAEAEKASGKGWMAQNYTVDQIAAQYMMMWTAGYPNSGSDSKGLLALTLRATPTTSSAAIAAYLKQHGKRVAQAKCLVEVLSAMGSPEALQVLVATATRFKQRTVRELAEVRVSDIAEARGWTEDELADRSVPSGGFEEDGIMQMDVGEEAKPYTARLGSDLSVKLFNPDGKEVKAIPAGKDENTKESKALLSAAKKTVKAVTKQQTTRLYDAMVGARVWPVSDWEADIVAHPILSRLVERIIWRGLDKDGNVITLFRPTAEGDRMTADGDDADLSSVTSVDIAHTATVSEDIRQSWLTHMDDFEVEPLFAQISRPMQVLDDKEKKATAITDREGWLTEAFKLRGSAMKANYDRGPVEDGAGFYLYVKSFRSAGIRAELNFTGSYVPEENIAVAVIGMQFKKDTKNYYGEALPLGDVPGMVLSEAWNDLHDIASTGAFDADWKKKGLY